MLQRHDSVYANGSIHQVYIGVQEEDPLAPQERENKDPLRIFMSGN